MVNDSLVKLKVYRSFVYERSLCFRFIVLYMKTPKGKFLLMLMLAKDGNNSRKPGFIAGILQLTNSSKPRKS